MFIIILIIAVIAFFVIRGYAQAKSRKHYANVQRAMREINTTPGDLRPSWISNREKQLDFIQILKTLCLKKGISEAFFSNIVSHEDGTRFITKFAALMELKGASFNEQITGTSDFILEAWRRDHS